MEEGKLLEENPSPKKTQVVSEKPPRIVPDLWEDQDPQKFAYAHHHYPKEKQRKYLCTLSTPKGLFPLRWSYVHPGLLYFGKTE